MKNKFDRKIAKDKNLLRKKEKDLERVLVRRRKKSISTKTKKEREAKTARKKKITIGKMNTAVRVVIENRKKIRKRKMKEDLAHLRNNTVDTIIDIKYLKLIINAIHIKYSSKVINSNPSLKSSGGTLIYHRSSCSG